MDGDIRDSYHDAEISELRTNADCERQGRHALEIAIKMHCRGQMIPDEIARYARTECVNLNRDLLFSKGIDPGPIKGRLEDYRQRELPL
jgi:hypothetical protein